jgi:ribosomal protein S18 acetylase RimI-like enzyme
MLGGGSLANDIRIERALETDLPSITSLLAELMEAMTDTESFDIEQAVQNCRSLIRSPEQYVLVARKGDNVLGFVNFSTRKTMMHRALSALIDELVVSKNYRGLGIGKQLIQAVVDECRKLGCCEVEVSTEKSNTKARRFYRSRGFGEDAVLLELDLGDSGEK